MKKTIGTIWCFLILIGNLTTINAQVASSAWEFKSNEQFSSNEKLSSGKIPNTFRTVSLDLTNLTSQLAGVSKIKADIPSENGVEIELPNPDGGFSSYIVFENSVVAPEVAHLYTVKTYQGYSKKNRNISIRFAMKDSGFSAYVYAENRSYMIETRPEMSQSSYLVYYQRDFPKMKLDCQYDHTSEVNTKKYDNRLPQQKSPSALRTLRLAMVSAGEFSQQFGGSPYSVTAVLNEMAAGVNSINEVYEKDFGITFILVSNASIVYPDPTTDPFDTSDIELQNINDDIDFEIGVNNYDIGHLIAWVSEGGEATSEACISGGKGKGFSPSANSLFELFIGFCTHEMGHQLGADHTFADDDCENSVVGFRYEVGRGSSIMGYSDTGCGAGYTEVLDPFFHSESIVQMEAYIQAAACHTSSNAGQNPSPPVANANGDITIPQETPFVLVGSASDGNDASSQLTYSWEQGDGSGPATIGDPDCNSTVDPLFRFRPPLSANYRVLPELDSVLMGINDVIFEQLPCIARAINFNLLVRDNNVNWGRTNMSEMVVTVANTGPFYVNSPDGGESWTNNTNTVSWEVSGTDAHCPNVDIILSTDGGLTYSVVAAAVPNNGSSTITLSGINTTTARILIQCSVAGNFTSASTFFDVSDGDFDINVPVVSSGVNWIGVSDTDWQNPANWAGGVVPDMTSDVIIPAGVPFYPVIDENITINTIDVQQGATIDIPDNFCFFVIAQ